MRKVILAVAALLCFTLPGCRTAPQTPGPSPELGEAQTLFDQQRFTEAIIACIDIARDDPLTPGLPGLQRSIMERLTQQRRNAFAQREAVARDRMQEDVDRHSTVPETYRIEHRIKGETGSSAAPRTRMEKVLQTPVSVHLPDITLNDFILELGRAENINILADSNLSDQAMTIHADDTPLREILDFVSRNLGVSFSVGENMIWVTAGQAPGSSVPLDTRIYRLRKGLSFDEIEGGPDSLQIIQAITRFVPMSPEGDLMFDPKAHALIVRDTRDNLELVESIIDALDVTPPQVLIEARFLVTRAGTMRELGVDWIMNSDYTLETKGGEPKLIVPGVSAAAVAVPGATIGTTGKYVADGFTAAVQGILTDPQFSAIIYALENSANAETLSVPRITVVNNKEAEIRIGRDFYYYEEWDFDNKTVQGDNNNVNAIPSQLAPVGTPIKEELGYSLRVTPSVGSDGFSINLRLSPEVSDFVDWAENEYPLPPSLSSSSNNFSVIEIPPLPVFERRFVETELVVGSGETVVMGGLIDSKDVVRTEGVPFLSKIPLLGRLFMTEHIDRESNNLLLFVTATVIAQTGESLIPLDTPPPGTDRSSISAQEALSVALADEATPMPLSVPPTPAAPVTEGPRAAEPIAPVPVAPRPVEPAAPVPAVPAPVVAPPVVPAPVVPAAAPADLELPAPPPAVREVPVAAPVANQE